MDSSLLLLLLLVLLSLPLFLGSRRQRKAMGEAQRLQSSLGAGERVMTTSGLHATVVGVDDESTVDLEISPGVRTTWLRAAIRERLDITSVGSDAGASTGGSATGGSATGGSTVAGPGADAVGGDVRTDRS